jgi:flagellin-specific chaperone FliS
LAGFDYVKKYKDQEMATVSPEELQIKMFETLFLDLKKAQTALENNEVINFSSAIVDASRVLTLVIQFFGGLLDAVVGVEGEHVDLIKRLFQIYFSLQYHVACLLGSKDKELLNKIIGIAESQKNMWVNFWHRAKREGSL